jgi:hypothetical protein
MQASTSQPAVISASMIFLKSMVVATTFLLVTPGGICQRDPERARAHSSVSQSQALPKESGKVADGKSGEVKILAEGSHSEATKPFVAIAREPGTYSQLRKLAPALPDLLDDFFKNRIVVAAFMGERNTGGYSVDIVRTADGLIRVAALGPEKGAMVTQVITRPFKVVSVPKNPWMGLKVESLWQQAADLYRVTLGGFQISGGFAGRKEDFGLTGELRVMREGKLATFFFDLRNSEGTKPRQLREATTGIVDGRQITIYVMDSGSLVEAPHGNLSATGTFSKNSRTLALNFTSLPTMIADGYGGGGNLEAEVVAWAPANKSAVDKY